MKTIFIFNDSRPTDPRLQIAALGEDARLFARVVFDGRTADHHRYAFGCAHELPADLADGVSVPVNQTREGLFAAYDRIYGESNWMPIWIDAPTQNDEWRRALELLNSRTVVPVIPHTQFSDAALARILEAIGGAPELSAGHVVH